MNAFFFLFHLQFQCAGSIDERIPCFSRETWATSTVVCYLCAFYYPLISYSCDGDISKKIELIFFHEIRNAILFFEKQRVILSSERYDYLLSSTSLLYEMRGDARYTIFFPGCESFFIEFHINSLYISRYRLFCECSIIFDFQVSV